jgi:Domain of unknown function (DUF4145)
MLCLRPMKCPHCNEGIHPSFNRTSLFQAGRKNWAIDHLTCPQCSKAIIQLAEDPTNQPRTGNLSIAFPAHAVNRPLPPEVPDPYRADFHEAVAVLPFGPKASAALSRRNLQAVLRDKSGTTKKDLFDQIEEVIASGKLPSHFSDDLHAVRNIGNFAAHEIKSKVTGAIVEVETGEAEWNLDVLESLFDLYFVEPGRAAKRKVELNKKLKEAGKPEIP